MYTDAVSGSVGSHGRIIHLKPCVHIQIIFNNCFVRDSLSVLIDPFNKDISFLLRLLREFTDRLAVLDFSALNLFLLSAVESYDVDLSFFFNRISADNHVLPKMISGERHTIQAAFRCHEIAIDLIAGFINKRQHFLIVQLERIVKADHDPDISVGIPSVLTGQSQVKTTDNAAFGSFRNTDSIQCAFFQCIILNPVCADAGAFRQNGIADCGIGDHSDGSVTIHSFHRSPLIRCDNLHISGDRS